MAEFNLTTHMPIHDLVMGFAGPLVLLALAAIMWKRNLYREFPLFFAYILYSATAGILREIVTHPRSVYFVFYWSGEALYGLLAFLVMGEVFRRVFPLAYENYWWFRWILPLTAIVILTGARWEAFHHPLGHGGIPRMVSGVYWFDVGVHLLEGGVLLLLAFFRLAFRTAWKTYEFGILTGFGLSAYTTILADIFRFESGSSYETFFRYGPPLAYLFATLVWLHAFWRPPELTRQQKKLEDMEGEMGASRRLLSRIRRGLGLREAAIG